MTFLLQIQDGGTAVQNLPCHFFSFISVCVYPSQYFSERYFTSLVCIVNCESPVSFYLLFPAKCFKQSELNYTAISLNTQMAVR